MSTFVFLTDLRPNPDFTANRGTRALGTTQPNHLMNREAEARRYGLSKVTEAYNSSLMLSFLPYWSQRLKDVVC